ncbi:MAG: MjaI family restriction endonuclease [Candidatus Portnoybacteria bacterium]|nr:MjaI family restriction endonuclease [Candidatus Portnoybacteria bacterium]
MAILKIKNDELIQELVGEIKEFPRYATQILNLANQNSQGTRPRVVGQLSELINECPEKTYEGWKRWYLAKHPEAIENATEKINAMVNNLKEAVGKIDKAMVRKWVEDLVLEKTFIGLRFQEAILKKIADAKKEGYKFSTPQEESRGIDGFIGNEPVSIKSITYKTKNSLRENIDVKIIFYEKTKNGLNVDTSELLD